MRALFVVSLASLAAGCGDSSSPSEMGAAADLAPLPDLAIGFPAPHPSMPQAQNIGGPVMKAPKLVAITFQGDSLEGSIDDFVAQLAGSAYWTSTTREFGVGPVTALAPFHSADASPAMITDAAIQTWLTLQIKNTPGFPQPDDNSLYAIFYPDTTVVSFNGGTSCLNFGAYHNDYKIASQAIVYAVLPRCPSSVQSVTVLDTLTASASHEFVEAATDPLRVDNPAWNAVDDAHAGWTILAGPELADLCAIFPDALYKPTALPYLVQRSWSNGAAAAGHDPCEPDSTSPYFNSAPVLDDDIPVHTGGLGSVITKGVHIPVGGSATVELELYSDAPTSGPWKVSALDVGAEFMGQSPELSFSFDQTMGKNGDKLHMTIKALHASQAASGASLFWLQSDLGMQSTVWLGVVGN